MHCPSHEPFPEPVDAEAACQATIDWWRDWCSRQQPDGRWRDLVQRSLITLKALTFSQTGGMVAAPTTSLPERLGGVRNWDYRFCWLRDAAFTLYALLRSGYSEEAGAWRDWLLRAAAGTPQDLTILFGLRGERRLTELELPWLEGYENSRPVRTGNAAYAQFQLDVYGEVMDTLHLAEESGLAVTGTRVGIAARAARVSRNRVAQARPRHLGGARTGPPLHAFQSDGMGCIRSRDPGGRALRIGRSGRHLAALPRGDP